MDNTTKPIVRLANVQGRHFEIARRYAWQRRKREDDKPDQSRLITLIRLRELERLFKNRYGRFLPDDDAGIDDLTIAAHHIVFLRGEIHNHIIAWARAWAPWMPPHKAELLADRVAAEPRKFTADALAWRLRLSMTERTALKITTIGAFDMSKAEREAIQNERKRERERARRAKNSSGRSRGRPRKNACHAGIHTIAGHGFSPKESGSAREAQMAGSDAAASTKENQISTARAEGSELPWGEASTASHPSAGSRAAPAQAHISSEPPPEIVEKAVEIARDRGDQFLHPVGAGETRRLIKRSWPHIIDSARATAERYHGRFDPERDLRAWDGRFTAILDNEYTARERYRERRRKWECEHKRAMKLKHSDRRRREQLLVGRCMTKQSSLAETEGRKKADAALAVRDRIAQNRADRAVRDLYGPG